MFCCYCSTLQHCSVPNVHQPYTRTTDSSIEIGRHTRNAQYTLYTATQQATELRSEKGETRIDSASAFAREKNVGEGDLYPDIRRQKGDRGDRSKIAVNMFMLTQVRYLVVWYTSYRCVTANWGVGASGVPIKIPVESKKPRKRSQEARRSLRRSHAQARSDRTESAASP